MRTKILTLTLAAGLLGGCTPEPYDHYAREYDNTSGIEGVEIDGCEYLYTASGYIAHKGNCKNEEHE